jgi:hypothetical protein
VPLPAEHRRRLEPPAARLSRRRSARTRCAI